MPSKLPTTDYRLLTKRSAFTLIEILVVISIIGLIVATAVPALADFVRRQQLAQASKEVVSTLRDAQSRSISSVGGLNWGVRFLRNQSSLELFSSSALNYDSVIQKNTHQLISDVSISDLTINQDDIVNVIFSVANGEVVFVDDSGSCLGGSADSSCIGDPDRCLSIGIDLRNSTDKRYVKVNERNIFESPTLTPCP